MLLQSGLRMAHGRAVAAIVLVAALLASAPAVGTAETVDPGGLREGATDLGDITEVERSFLTTTRGGAQQLADYFRFELTSTRTVGLGLRKLQQDLDLFLEDADTTVLASSESEGTTKEWLEVTLAAGVYHLRVEGSEAGSSSYVLRYGAIEPDVDSEQRADDPGESTGTEATQPTEDPGATTTTGAREVTGAPVLTVGIYDTAPAGAGFSTWASLGELADRSFTVDGRPYRILVILEHAGGLYLGLDRELPEDFVLRVGDRQFTAGESLIPALPSAGRYWWPTPTLGWSEGDEIDVSITLQGTPAPVDRSPAAPSAYFGRVPASHDGTSAFNLRLHFDQDDLTVSAARLRDHALEVTGGSVTAVEAVTASSVRQWNVTVQPDGAGEVTVALPAATDCAQASSVCDADGRKLRNAPTATVFETANADLAALSIDGATLSPAFDAAETLYTAAADAGAAQVTVHAAGAASGAEVAITPTDADSAAPGHQVALASDQTTVTVTVTDGGASASYWVVVSLPPAATTAPALPKLSTLRLDGLAPVAFQPDEPRYHTQAQAGATETTVLATVEESGASVEILTVRSDDTTLTAHSTDGDSATAGHQAQLSATGDTLILVVVTSADGRHQQTYVLLISGSGAAPQTRQGAGPRQAAGNNLAHTSVRTETPTPTLSALTLTGAALSPAFAAATTSYTASAAATASQVTVAATAAGTDAGVLITPADADTSTAGHQIDLAEPLAGGAATQTSLAVIVRSSDGTKLNAYTVTVSRAAPAGQDATLSALTVSGATLTPAFNSSTYSYQTSVASTVGQVTVAAPANDADADAVITPADADDTTTGHQIDLSEGPNTVTATVTASDDTTTRTYTVDIVRGDSNDAGLSALALDGLTLSPAFDTDTLHYITTAQTTVTQTTVTTTTRHSGAAVVIEPADADTTAGHQIDLNTGPTTVLVSVTAQDGSTTRAYTVIVVRPAAASDATLAGLRLDSAKLRPRFVADNYSYDAGASHDTARVTVWHAPANAGATVQVIPPDADPDAPGHQVDLVPVQAGGQPSETVIGIIVESADTTASETYAILITRKVPLTVQDTAVTMALPQGCTLEPLKMTDTGVQPARRWLPACRSELVYYGRINFEVDGYGMTTGFARFFRLEVLNDDEVTIDMAHFSTSYYIVLRDSAGTQITYRYHNWDGHCSPPYAICDSSPIVKDLDAGVYIIEAVQNYSYDDRKRNFSLSVAGDLSLLPYLSAISVDGTAIPGFVGKKFSYGVARSAAEVTIAGTLESGATAHSVVIHPADSDPDTDGHQVELSAVGLTEVWVTVVGSRQLFTRTYVLRFFGDPPPGTPLTASFTGVPSSHDGSQTTFSFELALSEPTRTSYKFIKRSALRVTGGKVLRATRQNGRSDLWKIVIQPDSADTVTVSLPASTTCTAETSICSFFGKRLSNSNEVSVPGPNG